MAASLLLGAASAQDLRSGIQKSVLAGSIIERQWDLKTDRGHFILVLHRPHQGGAQALSLLSSFAGRYTVIFHSDARVDREPPSDFDLTDLNADGLPEVYFTYTTPVSIASIQHHVLYDTLSKRTYEATITYTRNAPGNVSVGASLLTPAAAPYKDYLEAKVAASPLLQDPLSAENRAFANWAAQWERLNGRLGLAPGEPSSIPLAEVRAPLNDPRCQVAPQMILGAVRLETATYVLTARGVLEFLVGAESCALIVPTTGISIRDITIRQGVVLLPINSMGILTEWQFNPAQRMLSVRSGHTPR